MSAIVDGFDDERRSTLPSSVDRIVGQVVAPKDDGRVVIDIDALNALEKYLQESSADSNLDRLALNAELDCLIDGNRAVAAISDALRVRLDAPVTPNEIIAFR